MSPLLSDVNILSLAWQYPGPYSTLLLADMGAQVTILERPGSGDPGRLFPYFFKGLNRNKKSLAVDLQSEQGQEICHRLAKRVDVFTEGFRPGLANRFRIDYETIKKINPDIIYASISGYGQDGPYRDWPAHDLSYQGIAGMLSDIISQGGQLSLPPVPIADLSSGMFATIAILAALHYRQSTGEGQYIDVSMTDGLVSWMSAPLTMYAHTGESFFAPEPGFGTFETKDKKYLTLSIAHEDHFWANLCHVVGRDELGKLARSERVARREELQDILRQVLRTKTRDEWIQILPAANVAAGPAYEISEVYNDPQLKYRNMFFDMETPDEKLKQVGHPIKFSATPAEMRLPPPKLGEHNEEILLDLGYTKEQIREFERTNVI